MTGYTTSAGKLFERRVGAWQRSDVGGHGIRYFLVNIGQADTFY